MKEYLMERIAAHELMHKNYIQSQKDNAADRELSLAYNSQAAAAWNIKSELERALEVYEQMPFNKAIQLLASCSDELLHILRNNKNLDRASEIAGLQNETRQLIESIRKAFLNQTNKN